VRQLMEYQLHTVEAEDDRAYPYAVEEYQNGQLIGVYPAQCMDDAMIIEEALSIQISETAAKVSRDPAKREEPTQS